MATRESPKPLKMLSVYPYTLNRFPFGPFGAAFLDESVVNP
jgi:hypothetical protein